MHVLRDFLLTKASRPREENYLSGLSSKLSHENNLSSRQFLPLGDTLLIVWKLFKKKVSASAASNLSQSKIMKDDLLIK